MTPSNLLFTPPEDGGSSILIIFDSRLRGNDSVAVAATAKQKPQVKLWANNIVATA